MSGEAAARQVALPASRGGFAFAPISSHDILTVSSAQAPNYFAVSVPRQGAPGERGAGDVIMVWDARQRRLVSDLAYAVKQRPEAGQRVQIDGRAAVYVGQPAAAPPEDGVIQRMSRRPPEAPRAQESGRDSIACHIPTESPTASPSALLSQRERQALAEAKAALEISRSEFASQRREGDGRDRMVQTNGAAY